MNAHIDNLLRLADLTGFELTDIDSLLKRLNAPESQTHLLLVMQNVMRALEAIDPLTDVCAGFVCNSAKIAFLCHRFCHNLSHDSILNTQRKKADR